MTLVSVTVVRQTTNLDRARRLIDAHSNVRVDGFPGIWHATPIRLLDGDQGGTASAIKRDLLVLVAVRGVTAPETTALRGLSQVLRDI
jgi:hypothetical protein